MILMSEISRADTAVSVAWMVTNLPVSEQQMSMTEAPSMFAPAPPHTSLLSPVRRVSASISAERGSVVTLTSTACPPEGPDSNLTSTGHYSTQLSPTLRYFNDGHFLLQV